jgi:hypothetical protein
VVVDAEVEVELVLAVGKVNERMLLAGSAVSESGVTIVEDAAAAQSAADTVTVDTRVTATTLSVSMATVGIFMGEENVVVVVIGMELEVTIDDVVDVVTELESDEGVDDKI